ncbi:MAG: B12-binding domain-containing radical SAM protein [Planctomycetota bacterium]
MRITLLNPPQAHFTQPLLAIPSLAAYLRREGFSNVTCIDAGIESYDYFLSRNRLLRSIESIRAASRFDILNRRPSLGFSAMGEYQTLSEIALTGERVADGIDEAKRVLRTPELFYQYPKYLKSARTVEQALRLFSFEFAPTRLTPHGFVMRQSIERSAEIFDATTDEAHNPYIEYFREQLLPRLQQLNPDLIGLSVTFGSQAIPAFTLARMIKAWKPQCHITMGGGLLAYVAAKLAKNRAIWNCIDSFIMLEGERPLAELCEAVEKTRGDARAAALANVPNLIYFDSIKNEPVFTPEAQPLDIQKLPPPDFDGLPLDKYLSPELVLPLAITRGCYWGKCVFCTLYTVIGPGYRGRGVEQTIEDIQYLKNKYNTRHFYMVIEDLPPNMAKRLPRAILDAKLDIDWWCDARLEHDVFDQQTCDELAEAGCKRIAFGYESASKRVLDRMCKGIDPDRSMQLIERCHNSGISVTLYVMIGFPTETREEAEWTLKTVLANKDKIHEVSVRVFYLDETSEIYKRAREFDIKEIHPDPLADLQVYYDFTPGSGMDRREARKVYLDFTKALRSHFPVFQNTNMLYHELKSHYFLFLTKHGSWDALLQNVLEPNEAAWPEPALDTKPKRTADLEMRLLHFDRGAIDAQLASIDSSTVRPRYQSDLIEDEDRERLDRELQHAAPAASCIVRVPSTGEVHCITTDLANLLNRCDGLRTAAELLKPFPAETHASAIAAIRELAANGLIEYSIVGLTVNPNNLAEAKS